MYEKKQALDSPSKDTSLLSVRLYFYLLIVSVGFKPLPDFEMWVYYIDF